MPTSPTERRRPSIRLPRPLWIGVTAIGLAVFGTAMRFGIPIWRQQVAIQEIERFGGTFKSHQAGPQWLRDSLGYQRAELLNEAYSVSLSGTDADDKSLARLAGLHRLQTLSVTRTRVTNSGMANLKGLTGLEWLALGDTRVTDDGLAHLKDLPKLRTLQLENTRVTDVGLLHLTGLTNLEALAIDNTQVTDAGVAKLQRALPRLTIYR